MRTTLDLNPHRDTPRYPRGYPTIPNPFQRGTLDTKYPLPPHTSNGILAQIQATAALTNITPQLVAKIFPATPSPTSPPTSHRSSPPSPAPRSTTLKCSS